MSDNYENYVIQHSNDYVPIPHFIWYPCTLKLWLISLFCSIFFLAAIQVLKESRIADLIPASFLVWKKTENNFTEKKKKDILLILWKLKYGIWFTMYDKAIPFRGHFHMTGVSWSLKQRKTKRTSGVF